MQILFIYDLTILTILPCFSNFFFFEKVVYNSLINFTEKNNILFSHQYDSTSLAVIQLVNEITSSMDNKEYCAGIFF